MDLKPLIILVREAFFFKSSGLARKKLKLFTKLKKKKKVKRSKPNFCGVFSRFFSENPAKKQLQGGAKNILFFSKSR